MQNLTVAEDHHLEDTGAETLSQDGIIVLVIVRFQVQNLTTAPETVLVPAQNTVHVPVQEIALCQAQCQVCAQVQETVSERVEVQALYFRTLPEAQVQISHPPQYLSKVHILRYSHLNGKFLDIFHIQQLPPIHHIVPKSGHGCLQTIAPTRERNLDPKTLDPETLEPKTPDLVLLNNPIIPNTAQQKSYTKISHTSLNPKTLNPQASKGLTHLRTQLQSIR